MFQIALIMFCVGLLLGFVGAGGSGFIISILNVFFGFSIHISLGTALSAMFFSSISGSVSHYREGNMFIKVGIITGMFGAVGAWFSSFWSAQIPENELKWLTAGMLLFSALLLGFKMIIISTGKGVKKQDILPTGRNFLISALIVGLSSGVLSGLFGIGATPFIQIGLMYFFNLSIRKAAGTTMLIIIPIALSSGIGNYFIGFLDLPLLFEVVIGIVFGSYIGAKFTKRLPKSVLKIGMLTVPIIGSTLLFI